MDLRVSTARMEQSYFQTSKIPAIARQGGTRTFLDAILRVWYQLLLALRHSPVDCGICEPLLFQMVFDMPSMGERDLLFEYFVHSRETLNALMEFYIDRAEDAFRKYLES